MCLSEETTFPAVCHYLHHSRVLAVRLNSLRYPPVSPLHIYYVFVSLRVSARVIRLLFSCVTPRRVPGQPVLPLRFRTESAAFPSSISGLFFVFFAFGFSAASISQTRSCSCVPLSLCVCGFLSGGFLCRSKSRRPIAACPGPCLFAVVPTLTVVLAPD